MCLAVILIFGLPRTVYAEGIESGTITSDSENEEVLAGSNTEDGDVIENTDVEGEPGEQGAKDVEKSI